MVLLTLGASSQPSLESLYKEKKAICVSKSIQLPKNGLIFPFRELLLTQAFQCNTISWEQIISNEANPGDGYGLCDR